MLELEYAKSIKSEIEKTDEEILLRNYVKALELEIKYNNTDNAVNNYLSLGLIYYKLKNYDLSFKEYSRILKKHKNHQEAIYGVVRASIMLKDYKTALKYLKKYNEKNTNLLLSMLCRVTEENISPIVKVSNEDEAAKKFINYYYAHNYKLALELLDEIDYDIEYKNMLKTILTELSKKEEKQLAYHLVNSLTLAINCENLEEIIVLVKRMINMREEKLFCKSFDLLIRNNYYNEVLPLLNVIKNKEIRKLFKTLINQQIELENSSEYILETYYKAIDMGNNSFNNGDYIEAYDIYSWGYYVTNNPEFLYYIGKTLFELKDYNEAIEYFKEYENVGSENVIPALNYLTLLVSRYKYKDYKERADKLEVLYYK